MSISQHLNYGRVSHSSFAFVGGWFIFNCWREERLAKMVHLKTTARQKRSAVFCSGRFIRIIWLRCGKSEHTFVCVPTLWGVHHFLQLL